MSESTIDTNKLFAFFRKLSKGDKVSVEETHEATNEIYNMAAKNVVERVYAQLTAMRWMLGIGLTLLGVMLTLIGFMVAYGTFFAR